MKKLAFRKCQKGVDQLRGKHAADHHYIDNTVPLLPKSEISSLQASYVAVQPDLCRTWSESPKVGFLATQLNVFSVILFSVPCMVTMTKSSNF